MKNDQLKARRGRQERPALKKVQAGKSGGATSKAGKASDISGGAAHHVPTPWRWHHRVLVSLRNRLLRERASLLRAAAEPLEPHSLNEADSATDEFDHDMALTQLSAGQDSLYEVTEALQRIQSGDYGICEETGKAIPASRLRAIPWTRFTREAGERLEKEGMLGRAAHLSKAASVRRRGRIWLEPEEVAEEVEETPLSPPKDEALSHVFSPPTPPPGRIRNKRSGHPPKAAKGKGPLK